MIVALICLGMGFIGMVIYKIYTFTLIEEGDNYVHNKDSF